MYGQHQYGSLIYGGTYVDEVPPAHVPQSVPIYIGSKRVMKLFLGSTEITKIIRGSE